MKKVKEKGVFPWKKVFVIGLGVVFVAMMVFQSMGMSWLQSFRSVQANDSVTIDFTLRDAMGQPVLTTNQNLYTGVLTRGGLAFLTTPLTVRAGYVGNVPITSVAADNYYIRRSGQQIKFGILGQELDELDIGVLGMKTGEAKTIRFTFPDPLIISMKNYEFTAMGGNFTNIAVGDLIPLGISETPIAKGLEGVNSTPQNAIWRIATVINKTVDSIEVQHRYPTADITVKEFK
jgi:hypothetical protein